MNERDRYREQLRAQLAEWQADARKLRVLSEKASEEAQAAMKGTIEELDARVDEAATKLLELSNVNEEAWESVRAGFEAAWETLRKAVKDATERFKT